MPKANRKSGAHPDQHHVDLWEISLQQPPKRSWQPGWLLTASEVRSVEKMLEPHRSRRLSARASLRIVLSGYLGVSPANVQFTYGPYGKPAVEAGPASLDLEFNLSTTDDSCVIAVSRAGPVGVDIETMAAMPDARRLARRLFAPTEAAVLEACDDARLVRSFLRYWTAKEAYTKALGEGLSFPLAACIVPEALLERRAVTFVDPDAEPWTLMQVDPTSDVVGSLAIKVDPTCLTVVKKTLNSEMVADWMSDA